MCVNKLWQLEGSTDRERDTKDLNSCCVRVLAVLSYTLLSCPEIYSVVLYATMLYSTLLYCTALGCTLLYCTTLHHCNLPL